MPLSTGVTFLPAHCFGLPNLNILIVETNSMHFHEVLKVQCDVAEMMHHLVFINKMQ